MCGYSLASCMFLSGYTEGNTLVEVACMDGRFRGQRECVSFIPTTPECITLNPTLFVCACVCVHWCISYLSGLLTVPYQSSSYEPDRWDFKTEINVFKSVCMHVCLCVCCIWATWKQINSAVNSTPVKILRMYDRVHVCAGATVRERVSEMWRECMLVWLVFSKPFEALNDLIPSRYLKSPTSIPSLLPNSTEHNAIHLPLSLTPFSRTLTATTYL